MVPALAQEGPPAVNPTFYGRVFQGSHGGPAAPDGLTVAIYVEGEDQPRGTPMQVANGWYGGPLGTDPKYVVPGTEADVGKRLIFKGTTAATYDANGNPITVTFQLDQVLQVDLVIPDTTPPALTRTKPATLENLPYKAAEYTGDTVFEWTANEDLDTAAAPMATFAAAGAEPVSGTVTFPDARTVRVVLSADLQPATSYTLTVTGIRDKAGNEAQVQVQFTTKTEAALPEGTLQEPLTLTFSGGAVQVALPAGTVIQSGASLAASPVEPPAVPEGLRVAGQVVDITAQGVTLPPDGKVTIALKANAEARAPAIYYYNQSELRWEPVPGSVYDPQTGFVTAEVAHLSIYGVLEPTEVGPAPVVTAIDPSWAVAGKPDQTITVTGENFQQGAQVVLCREGHADTVVTAVYRSSTELAFTVPADLAPGLYMVKVKNPDGQTSVKHVVLTVYAGEAPQVQVFPGVTGTEPGAISPDGAVRVEVPVRVAQAYQSALVVIRVDDPDGRPMLAAVEGPLPANTEVKFSASFNLPGKAGTYTVKAFVWDGWEAMKVLTPAYEGSFTAGGVVPSPADSTPPTVASTDPADGAKDVPVDKTISVTFSEDVQPGAAYGDITLKDASGQAAEVDKSISGAVLTLDPVSDLAAGTAYTATIPAGAVKDAAGNALTEPSTFSFTTAAAPAPALELKVGDATGAPGTTVEVPVILTSQGQVAGLQFDLAFDGQLLNYKSIAAGRLTQGWSITAEPKAGYVMVMIFSMTGATVPSGSDSVAVLSFDVAAGAQSGEACDLVLRNVVLSDAQNKELPVNVVNGRFTVQ